MKRIHLMFTSTILALAATFSSNSVFGQADQVGWPARPNYETYRMDRLTASGDASYSGDLSLSIPVIVVPGRHGHDFAINLNYSSHITQSQKASWVGLGWNLDIGAVDRTIQGRADDQVDGLLNGDYLGPDPGSGNGPPYRGMRYGRMSILQKDLPAPDQDQADMYNVSLDGGGSEIYFIPDTLTNTQFYTGPYKFLSPQYKTWDIQATWDPNTGPVSKFAVTKEDGSQHIFGEDTQNGSIDYVDLKGKTPSLLTAQKYSFPYRWSLQKILYTDGSQTRVTYKRHNQTTNSVRRLREAIIMDRSYSWDANLFNQGIGYNQIPHQSDTVRYWYSSPESLFTDTHYLVFKSSTPVADTMTARNRQLDTLILFDRLSGKELKRVVFFYATNPNPNSQAYPWVDWQPGTRLANEQLTLDSMSVRTPDNIGVDAIPPHRFIYGKNPKFDQGFDENPTNQNSPGYRCADYPAMVDSVFSTAWRLKSITLPTGGRIEYLYQRLSGVSGDPFTVNYDPEGLTAPPGTRPFSYNAEPRCRIIQKKVVDTLGVTQTWTYSYGSAVYDAPGRPMHGTYQPQAAIPGARSSYDYYKYYRGCTIGHRWVQITFPDGSWKKTYFTSSYKAADKLPLESQPDSILYGGLINNATFVFSNFARRGMVWKEETNLSSIVYYYSYLKEWKYTDPYKYMWLYDNNYSYKVELSSTWARLDSVQTTNDAVLQRTRFTYNPTRIDYFGVWNRTSSLLGAPYPGWTPGVSANGLISSKAEVGDRITRSSTYVYACAKYGAMDTLFMLSQPYFSGLSGFIAESRNWTTFGKIGPAWLPISQWIWNDSSNVASAPIDTGSTNSVRAMKFTYDGSLYASVISQTDANNNVTNFYYSSDTTNPYANNATGLSMGRVTGIEKIRGGTQSPLKTSMIYDGYGNVTKKVDENGDITRVGYDKLGRIANITAPNGQKASSFSYTYFSSTPSLQPNKIASSSFRTPTDSTSSRIYYDGIGCELQRQTSFGNLDIISHTGYDNMRHPAQRYLAYQFDLGGASRHNYDPSFLAHTKSYNPGSGNFPFDFTQYEQDPSGRPINQFYSDTVFSNSDLVNNHYTKISYGTNGSGLPDFTSGSLRKTMTKDENGNNHISYADKLGNPVVSVTDSSGLALTTLMEYDATGRVVRVMTPNHYAPPNSGVVSGSLAMVSPQSSGQIDLTSLAGEGKIITVRLFADVGGAFGKVSFGGGGNPNLVESGMTVVFHICQYSGGNLVAQQNNINLGDYPDDHSTDLTLPYLPAILAGVDEVKLVVDSTLWYADCPSGTLSLDCKTSDGTYTYNKRGLIEKKTALDQGVTSYLYDKNGNLRLVKDASHIGTAANNTHVSGTVIAPNSASGQFTLPMPGPVTITTSVIDINATEYVTIRVKSKGVVLLSTSSSGWSGSATTLPFPKGTYTYDVTITGSYGAFGWDVSCLNDYEFIYMKYDALNRLIEQGEYQSTSASANFTKANAENVSFPGSGVLFRTMLYDTVSTDAIAAGQHNLRAKLSQVTSYRLGSISLTTFYSYDDFGRVEWVAYKGFGAQGMKMSYTYDLQNNITKKTFTDNATSANNYMWWYQYDQVGRLSRVYTGSDSLTRVKEAEYTYLATGQASQLLLGATPAQTVAYTYTDRGWLSTISSSQFWEHLGYNNIAEIGSALSTSAQYNGNISWMSYSENGNIFQWGPPQSTTTVGYGFTYDKANRLTAGNFGYLYGSWNAYNSYKMPKIGYDKNGNIDTLVRYGTTATLMDNFKYHYLANSNQLDYIGDKVAIGTFTTDIDSQKVGNYRYDSNGNLQSDTSNGSGIGFVIYDINNLPVTEYKRDGTVIQYSYDQNGQRGIKLVGAAFTWYVPGAESKSEILYTGSTTNPTYSLWANDNVGQVRRNGGTLTRYYYLKDHLGCNRMTVTTSGTVDSYSDYYPYGQLMDGRNLTGSADTRYKFTGKERDTETGYDYFGARYYDSRVVRWLSVDPSSENYPSYSPYVYAGNNPMRLFDPDGCSVKDMIDRFSQLEGKLYGNDIVHNRRMSDGTFSNNTIDCCGFSWALNKADKDSRLVLPMARVSDQILAFQNASPDIAEYIATSDPLLIQAGDYLFGVDQGYDHVIVAIEVTKGSVVTVGSGSDGVGQHNYTTANHNKAYLRKFLRGIGRVKRTRSMIAMSDITISGHLENVEKLDPIQSSGYVFQSTVGYSYDPESGKANYSKPDSFDPRNSR